jgi:hypothetical protein
MSDILKRRQTHFVLWCPTPVSSPPELIIGKLQNGNPPVFTPLARKTLQVAVDAGKPIDGLFELDATTVGLTDGETYHYWFEVENKSPGGTGRIQTTDPLASVVDYRLYAPANPSLLPSRIGHRILGGQAHGSRSQRRGARAQGRGLHEARRQQSPRHLRAADRLGTHQRKR